MKTKFDFLKRKVVRKDENNVILNALLDIREAYQEMVSQKFNIGDLSDTSDFKFELEECSISHKKGDSFATVAYKLPVCKLKYNITIEDLIVTDDSTILEFKAVGTFLKSITIRVSSKDLDNENVEVMLNVLGLEFNRSMVGRLATGFLNKEILIESLTSGEDALFDQVEAY